ncbi:hypothetical protein AXI59_07245 [Bacillus nakamurai]|nr:hypothetical protein AXI59_07245 [Bacillus nakamurai]
MSSWQPDRESSLPIYLQIEQYMKEKMLHGEWTVGTKISSQRKLADEFQVNRSRGTDKSGSPLSSRRPAKLAPVLFVRTFAGLGEGY